jgi:hypothetical protein
MRKKSTKKTDADTVSISSELFYALMKIAGEQIDPETAEVFVDTINEADLYGVHANVSECCVNRRAFVRNPGSKVWVVDCDVPEATREAIAKRERDNPPAIDHEWPFDKFPME